MSEKQEQQQPVPCPFCGEEWERQPPPDPEYPDEYEWWHPSGECWNTRLFDTSYLAASQVPTYNAACARMREKSVGTGNVIVPIAAVDGMINAARTTQRLFGLSNNHCLMRATAELEKHDEKDGAK